MCTAEFQIDDYAPTNMNDQINLCSVIEEIDYTFILCRCTLHVVYKTSYELCDSQINFE